MNYDAYFADALARLRDERRYRVFADLERLAGRFPRAIWHSPAGPPNAYALGPRNRRRFKSCASRPFGSKGIRRDSASLACSAGMLI